MRTKRRIDEVRTYNSALYDADRRLRRGLLTLSEYQECMDAINPLFKFVTVETISKKVMEFFSLYGVHIQEAGCGWRLTWY